MLRRNTSYVSEISEEESQPAWMKLGAGATSSFAEKEAGFSRAAPQERPGYE